MKKNNILKYISIFSIALFTLFLNACVYVNKTTPTLTISDIDKVYDGEEVNINYQTNSDGVISIYFKGKNQNDSSYSLTAPTNAGEYTVKVSITETDTYNSISLTKDFEIEKADPDSDEYSIPTDLAIVSGNALSTIDISEYNLTWTNGDTIVNEDGTYYATYTPTDSVNYKTITDIEVTVTVVSNLVTIPTLSKEFTYDSNTKTITTSDILSLDTDLVEIVESSSTFSSINVGTFEIVISLKDESYAWSDNTKEDKNLYWYIKPVTVTEPTVTNTSFTYDGSLKSPTISYNTNYIDLSGDIEKTNSGTYTLTFTLKDQTGNYVWATDSSYVPLTYSWKINSISVNIPTVENTSLTYTGTKQYPTITYNSDYINIKDGSTLSATEKGTYTITFILKDTTNYKWTDSTTISKEFSWEISAIKVTKPTLSMSYSYSNENKEVTVSDINNYNSSLMEIDNSLSTLNATNIGTYNIVIKLKDTTNYVWADNTTTDITLTWSIVDNSYSFTLSCESGTNNCYTISRDNTTNEYTILFSNINTETEYKISGTLDGNIVIDCDSYEFELVLSGVIISSSYNSPIYVSSADKFTLKALKNTSNTIIDNRVAIGSDDTQKSAAIYTEADLDLSGKGVLTVTSINNNGIHSKDDISVENLTLNVTCMDNALKGNDEVEIESGVVTLISKNGDGIKTSNSSLSNKGNQKGSVIISGGTITIYSASDGIDAAYNTEISGDAIVNIYTTSEYASNKVNSISSVISGTYYIMVSSSYSYTYSIRFKTSSGYTMVNASTTASKTASGYKYFEVDTVSGATSFEIYAYTSSQTQGSVSTYYSKSSSKSINTNYDTLKISSISSSSISTSWILYESSSSGNSDKLVYSAKGIKAANSILISGGTIKVYAYDDGLHANSDELIESTSSYGIGNVTLSGGSIEIKSHDDGVHADGTLLISGANLTVLESYEGIEATTIKMESGTATITSSDDGVNAQSLLNVTGGRLDVTVSPSGDTDGIDSNGSITISGGVVITRGPNNQNMCPMDADSTISITGGTVIIIGYSASTGSSSQQRGGRGGQFGFGGGSMGGQSKITSSLTTTQSSSAGLSKGSHTVTIGSTTISYTNSYSYSGYTTVYSSATATIN